MASIDKFTLKVESLGDFDDDKRVLIDYDIVFSSLDANNAIRYREVTTLVGDDTNVGDIGTGADDLLLTVVDQIITSPAVASTVHRSFTRQISRNKANEDTFFAQPKDELRAKVRLTDVDGQLQPVSEESNLVEGIF